MKTSTVLEQTEDNIFESDALALLEKVVNKEKDDRPTSAEGKTEARISP